MVSNRSRIVENIDIRTAAGLEIGALHNPIVKKEDGHILYVDYAPTEILRQTFRYPDASPDSIVETDIVWGQAPLASSVEQPVDYILASHVIEHVPDLIGWLNELRAALKDGGQLGLIVPDRRFTFDARRNVSSPGEMVEAYLLGYRRPSIRQIFDAAALSTNTPAAEDWPANGMTAGVPAEILERLPSLFDWVRTLHETQHYQDAHCWVFTPASFLDMREYLAALKLFPYEIERIFPTEAGEIDFAVRLRAVTGSEAVKDSIQTARRTLTPHEDDAVSPAQTAERQIHTHDVRIAALQEEIAQLKASSSWKITAPIRAAVSLLRNQTTGNP
ncbi:methyltransferase [Acetobacter estunensis]|nr:class I SAM-dependent methyltransferase [Acetobacter estunensis]